MSMSDEQWTFLRHVAKLIEHAATLPGYKLTGGELWRTEEQQRIHLEAGRSKTMKSKHMERLAVDFNLFVGGVLQTRGEAFKPLAEFWRSLDPEHNVSGYDWQWDYNHFERRI